MERFIQTVSRAELERRWDLTRRAMRDAGLDALVVQGANSFSGGGYYRWLSGQSAGNYNPNTLIFPADGPLVQICQGPMGGSERLDGNAPGLTGIGLRLFTPNYPSVTYTAAYDAALALDEIRRQGWRRVGLLGAGSMYHAFGMALRDGLGYTPDPAEDLIDPLKASKSAEEIGLLRQVAAMQDEILRRVGAMLRPGLRDFEVMAFAQYQAQLLGSEQGTFLGSSAPPGEPTLLRQRVQHGREIRKGDCFLLLVECGGPGGYYTHIARTFVLGPAPQQIREATHAAVEAQRFTLDRLKPGASAAGIFAEYNDRMMALGLAPERRLHCHGQGYDLVERPLARQDETMAIVPDSNMGVHPSIAGPGFFVTMSDNFLITRDNPPERLHRTAQDIIEL